MNIARVIIGLFVTLIMATRASADATNEFDAWSINTNGLQARLILIEQPKLYGTRWLVPFLELRNVRDLTSQMEVHCDRRHLRIELVDADGKVTRDGRFLNRSGAVTELNTIILPSDSSIRISLECKNWGIQRDAAAMVCTDSGAWVIQESEKGKVYLRATLTEEKSPTPPYWKVWYGTIQTPLLKIDWK